MATFNILTSRAAGPRSSDRSLGLRQSRIPTSVSISNVDLPHSAASHASNTCTSNNYALPLIATCLSCFPRGRHGVKGQSTTTTNSARTYAGTASPSPLESETRQQTSQHSHAETARRNLAWLRNHFASPDTGASAYSSDNDDANSDYSVFVPEDESDVKDRRPSVILAAYDPYLNIPVFLCAMRDTGAELNIISYPKARNIAPDVVNSNFSNVDKRSVNVLGGEVTVHGPIWVTFCLWNTNSYRTRYKAAFYVLPKSYGKSYFDALLNTKLVETLGLVKILHH
jgi:hypothetical protein